MMRFILFPLSLIYAFAMKIRNQLYDREILSVVRLSKPVVSVGNLTMGGTGKTPLICELLNWALDQGLRPAVISRGYKSSIKGIAKVQTGENSLRYGDEPAMVVKKFPMVPFYIGADRVAVAQELIRNEAVDIIFADDAFQHRRMGRDLDIVIIDCTESLENYQVLPSGRGRELQSGILRADYIILNKVNLVAPQKKQEVIEFIASVCGKRQIPVIESEYYVRQFLSLDGANKQELKSNERVLLVSGVGNPAAFEDLMSLNLKVVKHLVYRDHHAYSNKDLDKVLTLGRELNIQRIVTTEKDAVKMSSLNPSEKNIWVAELVPKLSLRVKSLHEKIRLLCH